MIRAFYDLVCQNQKSSMVVLEVGCWKGESTIHNAHIVKNNNGQYIVIDWFAGNINAGPGSHNYQPEKQDEVFNAFCNQVTNYIDIIKIYRGKSEDLHYAIKDKSVDICFIDADHHYEAVKNDIYNFLPKVRSGGYLCGHDCEEIGYANSFTKEELKMDWIDEKRVHPGVVQAVYDVFGPKIEIIKDFPHNMFLKRIP